MTKRFLFGFTCAVTIASAFGCSSEKEEARHDAEAQAVPPAEFRNALAAVLPNEDLGLGTGTTTQTTTQTSTGTSGGTSTSTTSIIGKCSCEVYGTNATPMPNQPVDPEHGNNMMFQYDVSKLSDCPKSGFTIVPCPWYVGTSGTNQPPYHNTCLAGETSAQPPYSCTFKAN